MCREDIRAQLLQILASPLFDPIEVNPADVDDEVSLINDLGFDSMQLLTLIVAMEHTFQFTANASTLTIDTFDRFASLVDYIENSIAAGGEREPARS